MRMRPRSLAFPVLVLSLIVSLFFLAPGSGATTSTQDPPTPPANGGGTGQERPGRPEQSSEPKPYDRVITKDAKSDPGIFTIHDGVMQTGQLRGPGLGAVPPRPS